MSDFLLHKQNQTEQTLVPDFFLDEYMPTANGEYVKVYLYLLRCLKISASNLSISFLADKFNYTENDVTRALAYWEKMNLLKMEFDDSKNLVGICLLDSHTSTSTFVVPAKELTSFHDTPKVQNLEPLSLENKQQLLFVCEQYLGKTLNPTESSKLLYFHDAFGFSSELIEYLVEYCVSLGHKSLHYISSVANAWHADGCHNVSDAKKQVNSFRKEYFTVLKSFGIRGRNPVENEISLIQKWLNEYGFSIELIEEACNRTMTAIHQPSFEYADSILSVWYKEKAYTKDAIAKLDASHKAKKKEPSTVVKKATSSNRFHNFEERDYDFEALERQLINNFK